MRSISTLFIVFMLLSCGSDDTATTTTVDTTLATYLAEGSFEIDNVIACASGSQNPDEIIAYVYPRPGATDIRFYETTTVTDAKNDYSLYNQIELPEEDFFNGYLKKFTREVAVEKWVIISFRESGTTHISNPIRLKHKTQNTIFTDAITVAPTPTGRPQFLWEAIAHPEDAIYFQVVATAEDDLLSGTYTFEPFFTYYLVDNVVLNITRETPPMLDLGVDYGFTLMGVSEDNWVNTLGQRSFMLP